MQNEIYVHETLARMERSRRQQTLARALALDESLKRRSLARAAAYFIGRTLVGLGGRLLSYGGSQDEAKPLRVAPSGADLARYTSSHSYSRN
jgi:hypothetical protein